MTRSHPYSSYRHAVLLLLALCLSTGVAYGQTNDPFVISGDQDYLFDVHHVDEAWAVTQGSPYARIGVQSLTGIRYGHEDLDGRALPPSGDNGVDRPGLGYATEAAGIAGARTNNALGMAGVARQTGIRTYSLLESGGCSSGDDECHLLNLGSETFRFREGVLAERMAQARQDHSVEVHLITYSIPSGLFNDYLSQGAVSGIAAENFPPPNPLPQQFPTTNPPQPAVNSLSESIGTLFRDLCFGSGCSSPPTPFRAFQVETASAVTVDGDVVVAPMGDHGPYSDGISYAPALSDRYVVTVGGVELNQANQPVVWDQTVRRPYVDVAAMAKDVVATSGESNSAYRTDFGGTVAAASITAGVASLIKARRFHLTGEDIEQVLQRTARDVGTAGFDDATGFGVVDAGRALRYAKANVFRHKTATGVSNVSTQTADSRTVTLTNWGNFTPQGRAFARATGQLKRFTGRVNFGDISPSSAPDVWARWAESDGTDTRIVAEDNHYESVNDFLLKSLSVTSVDASGFNVEGYYWRATFYDALGRIIEYGDLPRSPQTYEVAYTMVTPRPPLSVRIEGPAEVVRSQHYTWTARLSGGEPSYRDYIWEYLYECDDDDCTGSNPYCRSGDTGVEAAASAATPLPHRLPTRLQHLGSGAIASRGPDNPICGIWRAAGTGSQLSFRISETSPPTFRLRVRVTDSDGTTASATRTIYLVSGKGTGINGEDIGTGETAAARAEPSLPAAYALSGAAPNPFRDGATVRFALPEAAEVRLTVYDLVGREVARLAEGPHEAGHHTARFDGRSLPSGVYVVRLTAGDFVGTERVTLLR